ncbi:DNA repair protein complementing XP-C cells [Platysternon megacephalum]|uniref:DNA repair protein complementing XP-C cells n=1 Tax=Platysternon megacephalum TaxID=55544 RepID=A0A4D9EW82_9SAUR|nr:DNA repair protein complementing XP-C cells [Platysternon megacephalum]
MEGGGEDAPALPGLTSPGPGCISPAVVVLVSAGMQKARQLGLMRSRLQGVARGTGAGLTAERVQLLQQSVQLHPLRPAANVAPALLISGSPDEGGHLASEAGGAVWTPGCVRCVSSPATRGDAMGSLVAAIQLWELSPEVTRWLRGSDQGRMSPSHESKQPST